MYAAGIAAAGAGPACTSAARMYAAGELKSSALPALVPLPVITACRHGY